MFSRWTTAFASVLTLCLAAGASAENKAYDEAAMMEAWMKAGTPGEQHEYLGVMVGEWNTKMTSYEMGEVSEVTEGKAVFEMALDGRLLMGKFSGTMMGMPHQGVSMDGYDNTTGEYWSTWIDNMSTALLTMTGKMNDDGALEHHGTMQSPMGEMSMRFVTTRDGADKCVMKGYMTMPGMEQELPMMELEYNRVSS